MGFGLADFLYQQDTLAPATLNTPIVAGYENTCYTATGGMITVFKIKGAIQRFSGGERDKKMENLEQRLETWNKQAGVYISFIHEHNPGKVAPTLTAQHKPMRKTMDRFGMVDGKHLLDSREKLLNPMLKHDSLYMVIHTTNGVMPASSRKLTKENTFGFLGGQQTGLFEPIEDVHESGCNLFSELLKSMGILFTEMSARNVAGLIATMWTQHEESGDKYLMIGDQVNGLLDTTRFVKKTEGWQAQIKPDQATLPKLGEQIFTDQIYYPADRDDLFAVRGTYQAAFRLTRAPNGKAFSNYNGLREEIPRHVPYRLHIQLQSGTSGAASLGLKRLLSYCVAAVHPRNIDVARSIKSLEALEQAGYKNMSFRMVLTTWASNRKLLERNADLLNTGFSNWANAGITRIIQSPDTVVAETLPGSVAKGPAIYMPLPMLSELLPMEVSASPWESGLLMRSGESQPYPIDPGDESLINFHVYVLIGGTGKGKSVTMTDILKACIFRRGQAELPEVRYLDVGYTSKAMFNYLRYLLPDNQRHLIVHEVMQNTADYALNGFDTPVGMEEQSPDEMSFLSGFLSDLLTNGGSGQGHMDKALSNMLESLGTMLVSEAYRMMGRTGDLRRRYFNISDRVPHFPEKMREHGIEIVDGQTSWWELVDKFFEAGDIPMAEVAQRYAVPNCSDLNNIMSSSTSIQENYGDMMLGGTKILEYARTVLTTLITNYPVLAHETRLDFQQARMVGVDMQDVANNANDTSLFYSLLQNVLARGFMMDPSAISRLRMPDQYREYHRRRIQKLRERDKIFLFDELHRLSVGMNPSAPPPPAMMRLMRWIKEVRKFGIKLMLSTQSIAHMPDEIKEDEMWSMLFNMGIGPKQQKRLGELFNVSEYGMSVMANELHGPLAGEGAACLFMANTNKGKIEQKIFVSTSTLELWAAPTNQKNLAIMTALLERVGDPSLTARTLSVLFPTGSAGNEIDRLVKVQDITEQQAIEQVIDRAEVRSKEIQELAFREGVAA